MLCRSRSSRTVVGDSRDPTVAAVFFSDQVVDMPVVFNDRCLGLTVEKTAEVPQLQHIRQGGRCPFRRSSSTRYGRPVIMQQRLCSGSASDSVHRQSRGQSSCATEKGTRLFDVMAEMIWRFGLGWRAFSAVLTPFFRAPPVVRELSASFRALEHSHL